MGKRWIAIGLAVVLVCTAASPVFAAQAPSEKEEVVYADLKDNGQTEEVYVVNIFENQKKIEDYGTYESVRNMTSTDEIRQKGDQIQIATEDDILYYQGNLRSGEIPWDIGITYFLDGKECSAKELAGSSGHLRIRVKIRQNQDADPEYFENYALQVTAALNTENCRNITAKGATEANAGGNRQFTWTLLPKTEKTLNLTADVADFEMESISFNGVKMNLDVDLDKDALTRQFDALETAVAAIDKGAKTLDKGTENLSEGAEELDKGMRELKEKTAPLKKESKELSKKLKQAEKLESASGQVKGATEVLAEGTEKLKEGISYQAFKSAMAQQGLDLDSLKSGNQQMLQLLNQLEGLIPAAYQEKFAEAKKLLQGNLGALSGMEQYLNQASKSVSQADEGADALAESYADFDKAIRSLSGQLEDVDLSQLGKLADGAEALAEGSGSLKSGSSALSEGSGSLSVGTGELNSQTSGMSEKAGEEIDSVLSGISGTGEAVKSFVSEKNTNVKAVQFVIKNEAITLPEKSVPKETKEESRSLWQKFLDLFGIS